MDFLDSIDCESPRKKCDRVRSWYLYEQYKSLEKNQLDAAFRLKNKNYQEKILKQELFERRARRRFCDQCGDCKYEPEFEKQQQNVHSPMSASDDIFESFHDFQEEFEINSDFECTQDSDSSNTYEDIKSVERYGMSYEENLNDIETFDDYSNDDVRRELELVKKNIAENLNLQLKTVKENIEYLENYTKSDGDVSKQCEAENLTASQRKKYAKEYNYILFMWSKIVAFACKFIRINQVNCFYDCSSQFLIGILACDLARRGICNVCYILQPYVSPIKYVSSDSDISLDNCDKENGNKFFYTKNVIKPSNKSKYIKYKKNKSDKKPRSLGRKYHSENKWRNHSKYSSENGGIYKFERRGVSEPWCSTSKFCDDNMKNKWLDKVLKENISQENICKCRCAKRFVNPILQIARCVDIILQDIDE